MASIKGPDIGLIGSILVILYSMIFLVYSEYLVISSIILIMGILGVIGGIIGKKSKKKVSGILLILAGIGAIISSSIQLLAISAGGGFFPPITLIGGVLVLIAGLIVLGIKGGEILTGGESEKIGKIRIGNYFSDNMEEIKEGSFIPTYEKIKELPEFSGVNRETFRIARRQWYKQHFHMPFVKFTARLEKVQQNKQNQ